MTGHRFERGVSARLSPAKDLSQGLLAFIRLPPGALSLKSSGGWKPHFIRLLFIFLCFLLSYAWNHGEFLLAHQMHVQKINAHEENVQFCASDACWGQRGAESAHFCEFIDGRKPPRRLQAFRLNLISLLAVAQAKAAAAQVQRRK
jgi:hypothetical protein